MRDRDTDPRSEAVIRKWVREDEKKEAKAEALEERMKNALAGALKKKQNDVAREFMEAKKKDPYGRVAMAQLKGEEFSMMNESNWGDEITGEEELERMQEEDY